MSNFSRTACSLAPAYFHHWRSKPRISRSRSDSSAASTFGPELTAFAASMGRLLWWLTSFRVGLAGDRTVAVPCASIIGDEPHGCSSPGGAGPGVSPRPEWGHDKPDRRPSDARGLPPSLPCGAAPRGPAGALGDPRHWEDRHRVHEEPGAAGGVRGGGGRGPPGGDGRGVRGRAQYW